MPSVPAGRYRVYADIVHESGYAQTLVASVDLPAGPADAGADPDDSWSSGRTAASGSSPSGSGFADGSSITWEIGPAPLVEKAERTLRFTARDAAGALLPLEPAWGWRRTWR